MNGPMSFASEAPRFDAARLDSLCREAGVRFVAAFGSRVTGRPPPTAASDLDLAVLFHTPVEAKAFWTLRSALMEVFTDYSLDPVSLNGADPLLRWEAVGPGVLIWGDTDDFLRYRAYAYRDFIDSADLRTLEQRLFEKKLDHLREKLDAAS
ncbi:MAG: nucleotidyltransferase domain-containing protein [Gemmatimonadota bacterium]|jgi:predicted nucleotidyltransferase